MHGVMLDLEWNQPISRVNGPFERIGDRLPCEIIQIGAAKVDKNRNVCDTLRINVRPRFYKILHPQVGKLTGITQQQLKTGCSFPEAAEQLRRWCGNCLFFTWGAGDIPVLRQNMEYYRQDTSWLNHWLNLQLLFDRQIGQGTQKSLEFACDYYGIPSRRSRHDALNDALYTAKVYAQMQLDPKSLEVENTEGGRRYALTTNHTGFESRAAALKDPIVNRMSCPLCGRVMERRPVWKSRNYNRYITMATCPEHGNFFARLRLVRKKDGSLCVNKRVRTALPEQRTKE